MQRTGACAPSTRLAPRQVALRACPRFVVTPARLAATPRPPAPARRRLAPAAASGASSSSVQWQLPERQQQVGTTEQKQEQQAQFPPPAVPAPTWLGRLLRGAVAVALVACVALTGASSAWAARSGGRMGGSSFSSAARSSSYGSRSSYGSSYSALGSSMSSRPPSSAYAAGSSLSLNSFFFPVPWGYGGFGVGYPMGGGGFMSLLFWGVLSGVLGRGSTGGSDYDYDTVTLQVGLLGSARQLQRDLERIAARADTSSTSGLHYILQETVLALMRNPDYCVYGFAKSRAERSAEDAEQQFNELSLAERGKFQAETRSNVGGRSRTSSLGPGKGREEPHAPARAPAPLQSAPTALGSGASAKLRPCIGSDVSPSPSSGTAGTYNSPTAGEREFIVVTLLVAAEGSLKLPRVTSRTELTAALAKLGAVREGDLLAVEVLWTPEEEGDFFTQQDLAFDYPTLNTL
eukprot:scaffold22.g6111.t1